MDVSWKEVVLTVFLMCIIHAECKVLNEYIQYYEELTYSTDDLHNAHQRTKRTTSINAGLDLKFRAHGRNFHLQLKPDKETFSKKAEMELSDGKIVPLDTSHIYSGKLKGDSKSHVHGSIINKIFTGKVTTGSGKSYWLEHADKYFHDDVPFHSIIYAEHDVEDEPHRKKRSSGDHDDGACGLNDHVKLWMKEQQAAAIEKPENVEKRSLSAEDQFYHNMYSKRMNDHNMYSKPSESHRDKRATIDDRACNLFMQSDTMLWDRMTGSKDEKGLGFSSDRAQEEITSLFSTHVNGIKKIYEDTLFTSYSGGLSYGGITFIVHRVKINETTRDCPDGQFTENNPFCNPNIDVSNFLNLNSMRDHDPFCLAYIFTYRDFIGGTLGLAWVASESSASGGICERYKEYQEGSNGNRKIFKSLNTGIVTLINYNSPVPPKVSTLTFAHEVGHNFGSPHDGGPMCTPYSSVPSDPNGNFIMFASATSGDRPNNSKFSPCSKDNITQVLDKVFNQKNRKTNCFKPREAAFCGNRIKEEGEQCDCGFKEDCEDQCCHGRDPEDLDKQCKRTGDAECSPSEGPCCNHDCTLIKSDKRELCRADSDCEKNSTCQGERPEFSAACPPSPPKPNMTYCNDFTQVCMSGDCTNSICAKVGWDQCFLEAPENDKSYDKGNLCYVSCKDPKISEPECVSTGDAAALQRPENSLLASLLDELGQSSIKLKPGSPCNNYRGYCDVFQKCRDVDADGPLARLKKLLFNEKTFHDIRDWIIEHWWAVLLMGIGLIVFMGIFIKLCAVHTPSSNPKKPPPRKLMTLRRSNRPQGPPPPYPGPSRGGPQQGYGKGRGPKRAAQYEMHPQKV